MANSQEKSAAGLLMALFCLVLSIGVFYFLMQANKSVDRSHPLKSQYEEEKRNPKYSKRGTDQGQLSPESRPPLNTPYLRPKPTPATEPAASPDPAAP